jgi:hypothetical protein
MDGEAHRSQGSRSGGHKDHLNPNTIAEALLSAPGWARMGITAPNERLREDAALELARAVLEGPPVDTTQAEQLRLFL